jgi:DNA-binding response OmpR family regulator
MPSQRILYIGYDLSLFQFLSKILEDCQIIRCPGGSLARLLIESPIEYWLLLLDEELPEMTGLVLARFAREQAHRVRTPVIVLSAGEAHGAGAGVFFEKPHNFGSIAEAVIRLLDAHGRQ